MLYPHSTSARQTHSVSIHLDNLEQLQDRWAKQYESSKCPPPPPELNSPRSLAACKRCGVEPFKELQKLSLMQHLLKLSNKLQYVEETVASLSQRVELKAALQTAVMAFQRTTIGLGTSKEKLVAYIGFLNQEETRVPRLAELQRVRRQIIEEEGVQCQGPRDGACSTADCAASTGGAPSYASSRAQQLNFANAYDVVVSGLKAGTMQSHVLLQGSKSSVGDVLGKSDVPANSVSDFTLANPSSHAIMAYKEVDQQFHQSKVPYIPRNAMALNTNFFGNRVFKPLETVSNPSGAPLLCSIEEQPGLMNCHLRLEGVRPEMSHVSAFEGKTPSVGTLSSRSRNPLSERRIGGALVSTPKSREGGNDSRAMREKSTTGFNAVSMRDGANQTTPRQEKTSFVATLSQDKRESSETRGRGCAKEMSDAGFFPANLNDSVKQSSVYTFMVYGRELHEPFVYYCANPAPLLT